MNEIWPKPTFYKIKIRSCIRINSLEFSKNIFFKNHNYVAGIIMFEFTCSYTNTTVQVKYKFTKCFIFAFKPVHLCYKKKSQI